MPIEETYYEVQRWSKGRFVRVYGYIQTADEAERDVADYLKRFPQQRLRIVRRTDRVVLLSSKVTA